MRRLALAAMAALLALPASAPAHEEVGANHRLVEEFLSGSTSGQLLERHLVTVREAMIREGRIARTLEEEQAGRLLIDAVAAEWRETLAAEVPPDLVTRLAGGFRTHVLEKMNPVAIGRWLLRLARERGASVAIAFAVSEVLEKGLLFYGLATGDAFFVGLAAMPGWHAAAVGLAIGVPDARRLVRTWKRLGGIRPTLQHWARHRRMLPLDWPNVIDVASLPIGAEGAAVSVAIRASTAGERWLPRALQLVFRPRALASAEEAVSISLRELEALAGRHGIDVAQYAGFSSRPGIQASLLLREISADFGAHEALVTALRAKGLPGASALSLVDGIDLRTGIDLAPAEAIARFRSAGLTPDLLAERYAGYYGFKFDTFRLVSADLPRRDARAASGKALELKQALGARGGLDELAASLTDAGSESDWMAVLREARKLDGLAAAAERQIPALASGLRLDCARLLR